MIERISFEALREIEIMEAFGDLRSSRLMDLYRQLEKAKPHLGQQPQKPESRHTS
jgi:hypothetical protein